MNRNNRPMNNNLVNKFQSYMNTNTPFQKNPLLNNNPNFMSNSRDSTFFNKINMTKLDQIKRARNIEEIGLDKNQLTDIIISPITINKTNKRELDEIYNDIVPIQKKIVEEWWNTRTNQPYKNIIKKDLFNKDYKKYYRDDIFNTNIKNLGIFINFICLNNIMNWMFFGWHPIIINITNCFGTHRVQFFY